MTDHHLSLRESFVAAFPTYVASLLIDRGISIEPVIADGIVIGTGVLDGLLASFEAKAPGLATQSPLELFREALRPVDHALSVAGVEPPAVDANQRNLLVWDTYALSPGSAQQLGQAAQDAHLKWGLAKARAHSERPTAGLRCSDEDASRILEQLNVIGYRVLRLPTDEEVSVALIDIDGGGVDRIVSELAEAGLPVIVFGADPDDLAELRFRSLGATEVLQKRTVLDNLSNHIPVIA